MLFYDGLFKIKNAVFVYSLILLVITINVPLSAQLPPVEFQKNIDRLPFRENTARYARCVVDIDNDLDDDIIRFDKEGMWIEKLHDDLEWQSYHLPMKIAHLPIWSICAADLNNDGYNDLILGDNLGMSILYNQWDKGIFREEIVPVTFYCQRITAQDIDLDGYTDIMACNDQGKSIVLKNQNLQRFEENDTLIPISNVPGNYSAIWSDLDNNGLADLYISKCYADAPPGNSTRTNVLYSQKSKGIFTEIGQSANVNDNAQSWTSGIEDFDNDGDMDIIVLNHDIGNRLFKNNGYGIFEDVIQNSGIDHLDFGGFEIVTADFNNDGFMDFACDLKNELYIGHGDMTFSPYQLTFKPNTVGDFNRDGFMDLYQKDQVWINIPNENHWLKCRLYGIKSNANGIGAKIVVYSLNQVFTRELRSGQSYSPMQTLDIHFGLGKEIQVDSLKVLWPSGIITKMINVKADSMYLIPEHHCISQENYSLDEKDFSFCPGDSITLSIPKNFDRCQWNNQSTTNEITVHQYGNYYAIAYDSLGCAAVITTYKVSNPDRPLKKFRIIGSNVACQSMPPVLTFPKNTYGEWSTGSMTPIILAKNEGYYFYKVPSTCNIGEFLYSDSIEVSLQKVPTAVIDSIVNDKDSVTIYVKGDMCKFLDKDGFLIHKGNVLKLAKTTEIQSLSVVNNTTISSRLVDGGKTDTSGFSLDILPNKSMFFTVSKAMKLVSVDIYVKQEFNEGKREITLIDEFGNVVFKKEYLLSKGKNTIPIDFSLKEGKYAIQCDRSDQLMNVGSLDYPYPIAQLGSIDSSSNGQNFYPYFYHWVVEDVSELCQSSPVSINIEPLSNYEIDINCTISLSPNPSSNQIKIGWEGSLAVQKVLIMNHLGQLIAHYTPNHNEAMDIDISTYITGFYFVHVVTKENKFALPFIKL